MKRLGFAAACLLLLALTGYWLWPRQAEVSDGVMYLHARAHRDHVAVTVRNLTAESVGVEHCTYYTFLTGSMQQPMYKPCARRIVPLGPGESVTERLGVIEWTGNEPAKVGLRYYHNGQMQELRVEVPGW